MTNYDTAMNILAESEARNNGQVAHEDWLQATRLLFGDLAPKPEEVNTIVSIASDDDPQDCITIQPQVWGGELKWELYIPPTTRAAFDVDDDEEDFDPLVASVSAPHGETYWSSLSGAIASLSLAVKAGQVRFNDGRQVS